MRRNVDSVSRSDRLLFRTKTARDSRFDRRADETTLQLRQVTSSKKLALSLRPP